MPKKKTSSNNTHAPTQNILSKIETWHTPIAKKPHAQKNKLGFNKSESRQGKYYPNLKTHGELTLLLNEALTLANVKIVPGTEKDLDTVVRLVHEAELGGSYEGEKNKDEDIGFMSALAAGKEVKTMQQNIHVAVLLQENVTNKNIGMVHLVFTPEHHCELLTLSIDPAFQQKGYGSLLVAFSILEAIKKSANEITDNYNAEEHSVAQLIKFGFVPDDTRNDDFNLQTEKEINNWFKKNNLDDQLYEITTHRPEKLTLYVAHPEVQDLFMERFRYLAKEKFASKEEVSEEPENEPSHQGPTY